MDLRTRVREIVGFGLVRLGFWVAGFEPLTAEAENGLGGPEREDDDEAPIAPVALSPAAQRMVDEAKREVERQRAADAAAGPDAGAPRRGSIADRIARARAGG